MKKILDTIFSDNAEFVVRFIFAVVCIGFLTANLFGQTTETDKEITRQEQRDKRADYREFMIEKQKMYNKVQGQKQIRKMIIEKEKKRKFMKRKIRRERIKTFIIGIGIGYAIGGK
jgi:adenylate kinase|tara:strand:- start:203 stop:550 length:348 start_codon:yes stop_codon:yes gene_type:complete